MLILSMIRPLTQSIGFMCSLYPIRKKSGTAAGEFPCGSSSINTPGRGGEGEQTLAPVSKWCGPTTFSHFLGFWTFSFPSFLSHAGVLHNRKRQGREREDWGVMGVHSDCCHAWETTQDQQWKRQRKRGVERKPGIDTQTREREVRTGPERLSHYGIACCCCDEEAFLPWYERSHKWLAYETGLLKSKST